MNTMSRADWTAKATALFGADPRAWRFRCVRCGHVQSHESVKARNPEIGDTSNWIYFSCEGRRARGVGCDWTLGGLFTIHSLEVTDEDGARRAVFEFDDPAVPNETAAAHAKAQAEERAHVASLRTYDCWVRGMPALIRAKSRGKARYLLWLSYREAYECSFREFQKEAVEIRLAPKEAA